MNPRDTTRDIVDQVESLTGYPVEVVEDRALPAPVEAHRAGWRSPAAVQAHFDTWEINAAGLARAGRARAAPRVQRARSVWCMAGALDACEGMTPEPVQQAGFECAMPGLNTAEPKVMLCTLLTEYSALHVAVAIMVAAFQQFAPGTDVGIDLAREYEAAQGMKG